MPKYRNLDVNFHEAKIKPDGTHIYDWETLNLSALYDLRERLSQIDMAVGLQNVYAKQILNVLKRMDKRLAKSMPLR